MTVYGGRGTTFAYTILAVGTSKLNDYNPVVDSLTLVFNFVFKHEVWPKRWGQGIIFPIFKEG